MPHKAVSLWGRWGIGALMCATLFACVSKPRTDLDYDTSYDFLAVKSYAWLEQAPEDAQFAGLYGVRVVDAVDEQLAFRGMKKVAADKADILVAYHLIVDTKYDVDTFYNSWGYRSFRGPGSGFGIGMYDTRVREYKVGTLLVDMIDPKLKQVVWRGSASSRVKKNLEPTERDQQIREAVAELMAPYPPL
jgi:hypothetical protein